MFSYLLGAEYTNYFNFNDLRGISLCVGLILLAVIIVALALVFAFKRDKMKKATIICIGIIFGYALGIAIANVVADFKAGETYTEKYQILLISLFAVLIIGLFVVFMMIDTKKHTGRAHTKSIVYAAVCIALAFGLSYIRMFKAPYGGSITLFSLLPLALYSYMFGIRKGVMCGFIYGLLQSVQDPWVVHPIQYILDYPLAFAMVGLCGGLFRKLFAKLTKLPDRVRDGLAISLGILAGVSLRYFCHVISGAVYFGEYAADYGFGNAWTYSFTYNALYVFPDGAISIVGAFLVMTSAYFRKQIYSVINEYEAGVKKAKVKTEEGGAEKSAQA